MKGGDRVIYGWLIKGGQLSDIFNFLNARRYIHGKETIKIHETQN